MADEGLALVARTKASLGQILSAAQYAEGQDWRLVRCQGSG